MSLLVSMIATGRPRRSRCNDHRLSTTSWAPSRLVWTSSPPPLTRAEQLCGDLFERRGKDRPRELMRGLADRLLSFPAVQLLGGAVPIDDHVVHTTHEDGVVRKVEQSGLFQQPHACCMAFKARKAVIAMAATLMTHRPRAVVVVSPCAMT
jgi:hypothetical protein